MFIEIAICFQQKILSECTHADLLIYRKRRQGKSMTYLAIRSILLLVTTLGVFLTFYAYTFAVNLDRADVYANSLERSCVAYSGKWFCFSKRADPRLPADKGRLWMDYYDGSKWLPAQRNPDGILSSPPECFLKTDTTIYPAICFMTGADGWLYAIQANATGWGDWTRIQSGELASKPNCFYWVDGKSITCMPRTWESNLEFVLWDRDADDIGPRIKKLGGWLADAPICKPFTSNISGPFGCTMLMNDNTVWMVIWDNNRWTWQQF